MMTADTRGPAAAPPTAARRPAPFHDTRPTATLLIGDVVHLPRFAIGGDVLGWTEPRRIARIRECGPSIGGVRFRLIYWKIDCESFVMTRDGTVWDQFVPASDATVAALDAEGAT